MTYLADLLRQVEALGPWAPLAFILFYAVATVLLFPGSILTLAAGALFGLWVGVLVDFTGAMLGACAAFGVARHVGRERIARWVARDPRAAAVAQAIKGHGIRVVLLVRLSPLFPFTIVNYVFGLSDVRFRDYFIGSLGMLPVTFLYTYYGVVIGDVAKLAAGVTPPRGPEYYVMLVVGLLATAAVTIQITRVARRAMDAPRDDA